MKKVIFVITVIVLSMSCTEKGGIKNSLDSMNLKGNVKNITERRFNPEEKEDKIVKGEKVKSYNALKALYFDEEGNIIEEIYYGQGSSIKLKTAYIYDEAGKLIESEDEYESGTTGKSIYKTDEKGNIIEEKAFLDSSLFSILYKTYDEYGNMIKEKTLKADSTQRSHIVYTYDKKRNIIEQIFLTTDGRNVSFKWRYEYKFDNKKNWVWRLKYDSYDEPYLITEREIEYY